MTQKHTPPTITMINKEWGEYQDESKTVTFFVKFSPNGGKATYAPLQNAKADIFRGQILNGTPNFNQCFLSR
jgi:hypothetical protein